MYNVFLESTKLQTQDEKFQKIKDHTGISSKLISEFAYSPFILSYFIHIKWVLL